MSIHPGRYSIYVHAECLDAIQLKYLTWAFARAVANESFLRISVNSIQSCNYSIIWKLVSCTFRFQVPETDNYHLTFWFGMQHAAPLGRRGSRKAHAVSVTPWVAVCAIEEARRQCNYVHFEISQFTDQVTAYGRRWVNVIASAGLIEVWIWSRWKNADFHTVSFPPYLSHIKLTRRSK